MTLTRQKFLNISLSSYVLIFLPKVIKGAVNFATSENITVQNPYNGYVLELPSGINNDNKDDIRSIEDTLIVESDKLVEATVSGNSQNFNITPTVEYMGGNTYHVHLKMQTGLDQSNENVIIDIHYDPTVGIGDNTPNVPKEYKLGNFPNPFNPTTTLAYTLPKPGEVKVEIYDIKGSLVKSFDEGKKTATNNELKFDATGLSSGMYIARLYVDGKPMQTHKMMLTK